MTSLKRNFIYNLTYQILLVAMPLIVIPYVSRVLGPENIGIYSYTHSIANYFVLFGMLGLMNYGNRSISRVKDSRKNLSETFWNIYAMQMLSSLIIIVVYLLYLFFSSPSFLIISLIQFIYVFSSLVDINWFFFGMENFKYTVIRSIITKLLNVISIFLFVNSEDDLWIYTLIMAGTLLVSHLLLWPLVNKYVDFVRPTINNIKEHLMPNLVLFVPVIAISMYNIMDKVMVGQLSTMTELGYYENTSKIINVPFGVITALGTVMIPRMSSMYAQGKEDLSIKYINISMSFIIIISSAMAFGIAGVAPVFAPVFFGNEFSAVGQLITVISPIIFFKAWANVIRTQFLIPRMRDKEYIVSVIIGAILNFTINILLIRFLGALGAVIGTVAAEAAVAIYQTQVVKNELNIKKYFTSNIFFVVNGLVMFLIIRLVDSFLVISAGTLIVEILIGAAYYIISCFVFLKYIGNHLLRDILIKK